MLDWTSEESLLLANPRLPQSEQISIQQAVQLYSHLKGHIWLSTSGSTALKWAALPKTALLESAAAVNRHLNCTSKDRWINPLPSFHVGGLSVYARASLAGFQVIDAFQEKWNAYQFHERASVHQATLSALVPTQVYDLVTARLQAPKTLRAVVVGGGGLSEELFKQAQRLGWKLLPSYGLTECCSQVATVSCDHVDSETIFPLKILDHFKVQCDEEGKIVIKGNALLTGYFDAATSTFIDPKIDGTFQTEDLGKLEGGGLRLLGRTGGVIKIGGESVNMHQLEQLFEATKLRWKLATDAVLIDLPDVRLGRAIYLAATGEIPEEAIIDFHQHVLPFARIRGVHRVSQIPRTSLGKLKRTELQAMLKRNP